MDKETAIRIIRKPAPCLHENTYSYYPVNRFDARNEWFACADCGAVGFGREQGAQEQKTAREYYKAVEYLRSLPEPTALIDDEFEQIYSEWWHEYDKHYNYMEISQTGFRIVRKGQVILSILYE